MIKINVALIRRISEIASKALSDSKTQKMLAKEHGVSSAKSMTTALMLSHIVKGECSEIQRVWASVAGSALNDCDVQERLFKNHQIDVTESTVAAIVFMRIGDKELISLPDNLDEYHEMIEAMKHDNFDNPVYKKVAG